MKRTGHAVVVGLDRSTGGRAAVEHAATLAERRHLPLRLVHAFEPSQFTIRPMASWAVEIEGAVRTSAEGLVEETLSGLAHDHPELSVSSRLQPGSAVVTLLEESRSAECVVLGSRGSGDFVDLLIGSTTLHVASQAHCPVIAVQAPKAGVAPRYGVIVGVDGSADSEDAIDVAFQLATETREPLRALHAWTDPSLLGPGALLPVVHDPALVVEEERLVLAESMAGWSEKYPDVAVEQRVVRGHPVGALVEAGADASYLVVGAKGRGPLRSMLLGSVSHGVLHHADGPVVVVRRKASAS
jgi:nucleotide-binding universal stress UspA family protein